MGTKRNIFNHPNLREFFVDMSLIRLKDEDLLALDSEIMTYELASPNDIRQALINRNEILSSYAISQAEKSSIITPKMANEIRAHYEKDQNLTFPSTVETLGAIERNFDHQEYLNILKTFRWVSSYGIRTADLSSDLLVEIHRRLTFGMDDYRRNFFEILPDMIAKSKSEEGKYHWYLPGLFRADNSTMVGAYSPVDYKEIKGALNDAIGFFKSSPSLLNLNIFAAVLYAIHPFSNGNKRLCRILEHALLRDLGLNRQNVYGHAYYFFREIDRFYESLSRSLETKNLCPFINFSREGIFFSMLFVYEEGIKSRRREFLDKLKRRHGEKTKVLNSLVIRKEETFGELLKSTGNRGILKRSLINHLNTFLSEGIVTKRRLGREMLYSLNLEIPEETKVIEHLDRSRESLSHIPHSLSDSVFRREGATLSQLAMTASAELVTEPRLGTSL